MILDIACGVIILVFALIGIFRGFARQIFSLFGLIASLAGAILLLKPIYDILDGLFLGKFVDMLANLFGKMSFLDSYAATLGKTTGVLLSEYVVMFLLFVVLTIVLSLLLKLLKKIIIPICDLPFFKFFDKIFGLGLGILLGLLLIFVILTAWQYLTRWSVIPSNVASTLKKYYNMICEGSVFVEPYLSEFFAIGENFLRSVWHFIKGGVKVAA